jgi:hypothetical protein
MLRLGSCIRFSVLDWYAATPRGAAYPSLGTEGGGDQGHDGIPVLLLARLVLQERERQIHVSHGGVFNSQL